ncbi:hypothetical protein EUGRSUZ_C02312 [Eucalyptus grandis]|uniref:Uncharacterized protein n=2 Tax=Eucalyptus grandis TaxID=71139 RepID=A0ACC3LGF8_EUCGR|nr:hypothetical protein EUGRSUZ_C02312 [Eucalyptus grandis]
MANHNGYARLIYVCICRTTPDGFHLRPCWPLPPPAISHQRFNKHKPGITKIRTGCERKSWDAANVKFTRKMSCVCDLKIIFLVWNHCQSPLSHIECMH